MTPDELAKLIEGLIVISGIAAIVYAVFKNSTVKQTIQSQKELIETLTSQVAELRTLHIENEKAIARLNGEVSVYKELPLTELSKSMQTIVETQQNILKVLKEKK
jgi:regulator of replication initiation timing